MAQWYYLFVLLACLVLTAPLEFFGRGVYRRPRLLVAAVVPPALVFVTWDVLAIAGGVWNFNGRFLVGVILPGAIPLEEVLFFLVVPICGLLTFVAVETLLGSDRRHRFLVVGRGRCIGGAAYIVPAMAAVAAVCVAERAVLRTGLLRRPAYWVSMVIMLGFQIPVDGWLTRLDAPVVRYNPDHILGARFPWDIPIEDFLFGFALVTAVLLCWEWTRQQKEGAQS